MLFIRTILASNENKNMRQFGVLGMKFKIIFMRDADEEKCGYNFAYTRAMRAPAF